MNLIKKIKKLKKFRIFDIDPRFCFEYFPNLVKPSEINTRYRIVCVLTYTGSTSTPYSKYYRIQRRYGIFWGWITKLETYEFLRNEPYTERFLVQFSSLNDAEAYIKKLIPEEVTRSVEFTECHFDDYGQRISPIVIKKSLDK